MNRRVRLFKRVGDFLRRFSARLRQVGAAAAAAADDRGDLLEPVARVQPALDQVFRKPGDELNLTFGCGSQENGQAGLSLAPHHVDQLTHLVWRDVFYGLNDDRGAAD